MKITLDKSEQMSPQEEAFRMHTDDKNEIVFLRLSSGEEIKPHTHQMKAIFFVVSGKVQFIVDSNEFTVEPNELLSVRAEQSRSIKNLSANIAEVLVIKQLND